MGPTPQQQLATAMLEMTAMFEPIGEAVDGYRADLERRGYSPTAAETMALDFHRFLIAQLIGGPK